jgi:N-glycosylase/DNA lyase
MIHYGLAQETERWQRWQRFQFKAQDTLKVMESIRELLSGSRGEVRTLVYQALRDLTFKHRRVETMRDLTESVTQGELSWRRYVAEMALQIKALSSNLQDQLSNPPDFAGR